MTRVGGAITVESDGQRGATFRLLLPRAEDFVRAGTGGLGTTGGIPDAAEARA
jgi:hypothetical protein